MLVKFAAASAAFGLSINIGKTEVLYQRAPGMQYDEPTIMLNGEPLKSIKHFKYLGSRYHKWLQLRQRTDDTNLLSLWTTAISSMEQTEHQAHHKIQTL